MTGPNSSADRLDSWKEIGEYVGRDVRTAIRWESERGLPVHRVPGGKRGSVFALRSEIDRWLMATAEASPRSRETSERIDDPDAGRGHLRSGWPLSPMATAALGLLVIASGGLAWRARDASAPGDPVRAVVRSREIVAFDGSGRQSWVLPIEGEATLCPSAGEPVIADIDGDGGPEVLASVDVLRSPGGTAQGELLCLDAKGKVRWRRVTDDRIAFRGARFGSPWQCGRVVAYATTEGMRVAWSQCNSPSWAGLLSVFDPAGQRVGRFVHSGNIFAMTVLETPAGPRIVAGGVSNSQRAAAVFVLDGMDVRGHSVEPMGSPYECLSCEAGAPLRYFVFPPTELSRASGGPYNAVSGVHPHGAGVRVTTAEDFRGGSQAQALFWFSRDLELESTTHSDSWPFHDSLQRQGRLDHSASDCPMYEHGPRVLEGDPVRGWREALPASSPSGR